MALNSKKLKEVQENLKTINDLGTESKEVFKDIATAISGLARDSKDFKVAIGQAGTLQNELVSSAKMLTEFSKLDLKNKKDMKAFNKAAEDVTKKRLAIESKIRVLNSQKLNATKNEQKILGKTVENLQNGLEYVSGMEAEYEKINQANKELNSSTKWMDTMEKTLGSIPGIGPLISGPFKEASQAMRDAKLESGKWYDVVEAGGEVLFKAFGPAAIIGMLIKASDHTTEIQRSLEMSTHEAERLNSRFSDIAFNSGDSVMHQKNLHEALQGISKEMGVVRGISDDQVKNQVFLTKKMGLSEKSAAKFAKYQTSTGKSSKETNKEIESATKNLAKETGIVFKLSDIFDDVANTNAGLKAAYGFNNKLLAEQVVKTKQLGINMEQAEKIASGMLDFESSIQSELEAELLTGKDINLEEARRLALMGKSSEAAAEILNQVGSSHDLAQMNVIQQEALAKAAGMERNELIASVKERENLKKLGKESIADALKAGISREKIAETMGQEALAAYDNNKATEDFQGMLTKIQMKLSEMLSADAGLGKIVRFFGDLLNNSYVLYGIIGSITALIAGGMISSIGKFIAKIVAFFATKKTADATAIAAKLEQNALDTAANTLQGTKNGLLATQLATEQAILAAKVEQNVASGVGNAKDVAGNALKATSLSTTVAEGAAEATILGTKQAQSASMGGIITKGLTYLGTLVAQAAAAIASASALTLGIGLVGILAATAAGVAYLYSVSKPKKVGDMMSRADGKTQVSTKEGGLYELSDNDDLVAAPGAAEKMNQRGGGARRDAALIAKVEQLIAINQQILAKSPVIEMGGNEVGQGINTAEREIQ
tara:strand:+ start:583 stop:3081 length:2499 start_codon:yes stop_codon:yes gene_type:complete